ncbi:hypothetical protein WA026_018808 [Henosepilachna vigintioctopunctata]|uniref:Uncharacterized protein n=1 Tax=Henosepilachna vigintioctopunctata TaxID=420089 RepID=A0AAW1TPD7_9CUCU
MNPNNHNPTRRNSSSFSRHTTNHPSRSHGHTRWANRYTKDYGREYDGNFNRGEPSNVANSSPKETNFPIGYPKPSQMSPVLRNNHIHYNSENPGMLGFSGHQIQTEDTPY